MSCAISLTIDKSQKSPAYKQVAQQISELIRTEQLHPGDRLPTERQLSQDTGIARGTIKAAYALLLESGKIETRRGSGSFVASKMSANSIEFIRREIRNMLEKISDLQIHPDDLLGIFQDELKRLPQTADPVNIAWIDCCDECVWAAKRQLQPIDGVGFAGYLLNDVSATPTRLWDSFELIITTTNHFRLLTQLLPGCLERLQQVTMDLSRDSAISIAQIPAGSRVITLCRNQTFSDIMQEQLRDFDNLPSVLHFTDEDHDETIKRQLQKADYAIVYADYAGSGRKGICQALERFSENGGIIIPFDYRLDRGSILHIKELVEKSRESCGEMDGNTKESR